MLNSHGNARIQQPNQSDARDRSILHGAQPEVEYTALGGVVLLVVAYELVSLFNPPPAAERIPLPRAFQWFGGGGMLMYLLMAVGLGWTENEAAGWFALEVKFSPACAAVDAASLVSARHKRIGNRTESACCGLAVFMGWRFLLAGFSGDVQLWRYDGLAGPFHPTYMGFYLVLMPLLLSEESKGYRLMLVVTGCLWASWRRRRPGSWRPWCEVVCS